MLTVKEAEIVVREYLSSLALSNDNLSQSNLPKLLSDSTIKIIKKHKKENRSILSKPIEVNQYITLRNKGFFTADLLSAQIQIPKKQTKICGVFKRVDRKKQPPKQFRPYYDSRLENLFTEVKLMKINYKPKNSEKQTEKISELLNRLKNKNK